MGSKPRNRADKVSDPVRHAVLDAALERVQDAANEAGGSAREVVEVRVRLDEIRAELARPTPSAKRARDIVDALQDKVPWAYPIVMEALATLWPRGATRVRAP
jgi:hypothetical protein